jgi:hypothetical protein
MQIIALVPQLSPTLRSVTYRRPSEFAHIQKIYSIYRAHLIGSQFGLANPCLRTSRHKSPSISKIACAVRLVFVLACKTILQGFAPNATLPEHLCPFLKASFVKPILPPFHRNL